MQSLKLTERIEPEPVDPDDDGSADAYDMFEMVRVICPDCAQPIALLADEDVLPEHARCPTPWNPFVLTVCAGTGRGVSDARPADETLELQEQEAGLLLTLPRGSTGGCSPSRTPADPAPVRCACRGCGTRPPDLYAYALPSTTTARPPWCPRSRIPRSPHDKVRAPANERSNRRGSDSGPPCGVGPV